jgi:uncharacterized protein (DUF1501 family)
MTTIQNLSRRGFLQGTAGLTLGLALPGVSLAAAPGAAASFEPTPFCASAPTTPSP